MLTITKEFTFDCAHMLSGHEGLCKNLHGHTYKLQIEVYKQGAMTDDVLNLEGPNEGMVIDFAVLKSIVKDKILNNFDHAFIFNCIGSTTEQQIAQLCREVGMRVVELPWRPTAEYMAIHFASLLKIPLAQRGIALYSIKLWETPTSFAEYVLEEDY